MLRDQNKGPQVTTEPWTPSLGKYFPSGFFPPCLGLHIYDVTSVGMVTIPCKETLLSLEFNESTLQRKEYLF